MLHQHQLQYQLQVTVFHLETNNQYMIQMPLINNNQVGTSQLHKVTEDNQVATLQLHKVTEDNQVAMLQLHKVMEVNQYTATIKTNSTTKISSSKTTIKINNIATTAIDEYFPS
jgi:hypothetical protein